MANTVIQLKHSTLTGNVPSSLANGEISINSRDGKFFYSTPAGVVTTHYPYLGPAGLNKEIQFNDGGTLGSSSGLIFDKASGYLTATSIRANQSSGDEGGQIDLATAATNQSLSGGYVNIDIFQNKLRIFESGGTNRGVYIDLANGASASVGTNLLSPSSSTDGWARGQANAAFLQANTPSATANSAATYANSAFTTANNALTSSNGAIAWSTANSAASYANSAFLRANTPSDVANSAASYANSAFGKSNSAFLQANTPSYTANSAALYANAAFTRANNSLDANNGGTVTGTITATSFITTGSFGNIQGANTVYANNFVANTGFIQFSDGSKQYTANAGSGTFGTDAWARGQANAAFAQANTAQSTASSAQGTADSAAGTASAALSAAGTAQSTADSAAIYANGAFAKANTGGGSASFGDYFPIATDYGNLTDPSLSAFGELLLVAYDCRIDPITPSGYFLTKDFGYVA
jgi:hypothetical protein